MQIAFHIGANCTDEDRLIKSLLKNADVFLKEQIAVPGPGRYRKLIRETIAALKGAKPADDTRNILLDTIVENDNIGRVVLSNGNFICIPPRIFDHGLLYSQAGPKARALRQLFPKDDITLFMGIRNPATFLQETFLRSNAKTIDEYLGIMRPTEIQWSDMIRRIREDAPDVALTVWCNEDAPLLWEQIMREISGVNPDTPIVGGLDMLATIISRDGMQLLYTKLQSQPPQSAADMHEMIAEIWETHALDDQVEDEINQPELDPALLEQMTEMYDADVAKIASMQGVKLLLPFD